MRTTILQLSVLLGTVLAAVACEMELDLFGPGPTGPPSVRYDYFEVAARTTGEDLDPDGYVVEVLEVINRDSTRLWRRAAVGVNDAKRFSYQRENAPSGAILVALVGVAANCIVADDNPRRTWLKPRLVVEFEVTCAAL